MKHILKFAPFILFCGIISCQSPKIIKENKIPPAPIAPVFVQTNTNEKLDFETISWQEFFKNPKLQELINLGLAQNSDLKIAALNIEKARNNLALVENALKPNIRLNAGANIGIRTSGDNSETYNTNLGLTNYEIDVFGRLKTINEQKQLELIGQKYTQSAIKLALIAEISKSYLSIQSDLLQIDILNENIASISETLKIISARQKVGLGNDLEVNSAKAQLFELNTAKEAINTKLGIDNSQLRLLLASQTIDDYSAPNSGLFSSFGDLPENLSSKILLARPDIRASEIALKVQNANIDAARLAKFPQINLTSNIGFSSTELLKLLNGGIFNFIPNISMPIFDNGNANINIENAIIEREIALSRYEKSIQTAFFEVSSSLEIRAKIDERIKAQENAIDALKKSEFIAKERFRIGIDNYLPLLLLQRQLNNAQLSLIAIRELKYSNQIALFKAIGNFEE